MSRFFAPEFKVEINRRRLSADISKSITDISVQFRLQRELQESTCSLTIANPYPELPWTHGDDQDLFAEGNEIVIHMGYVDDLHVLLEGDITGISPNFPASGNPTLQVEARDRSHRLQLGRKERTLRDVTDTEIAQKIASDHNLSFQGDSTEVRHPHITNVQGQSTPVSDLDFLRSRARTVGFEVYVEGSTLYFTRSRQTQAKSFTLVWGRTEKNLKPTLDALPLIQFQPSMKVQGQVTDVVVRGQHPTTREVIEGRAGEGDEDSRMGGSETGPQVAARAFGRPSEMNVVGEPVSSQQEDDQLARALYNERASGFVEGRGSTIGLPGLRPGRVIELHGLGKRFSGEYYVTGATHRIGGGGYQTDFQVRRNSIG
jgi:uncharacterized protein